MLGYAHRNWKVFVIVLALLRNVVRHLSRTGRTRLAGRGGSKNAQLEGNIFLFITLPPPNWYKKFRAYRQLSLPKISQDINSIIRHYFTFLTLQTHEFQDKASPKHLIQCPDCMLLRVVCVCISCFVWFSEL